MEAVTSIERSRHLSIAEHRSVSVNAALAGDQPLSTKRVLLVEDEAALRYALAASLQQHGFYPIEAADCRSAEERFRNARPDAIVTDNFLPDGTALELLPRLKAIDSVVPVLVLTGDASIDLAVKAMREGAEYFLTKPVDMPALLVLLDRMVDEQRRKRRLLADSARSVDEPYPFLGTSPAIRQLRDQAERVAQADATIVLEGETGSGKGILAKWIHRNSHRAEHGFVDLNCAGLSRDFLETELFGHEKGAFTSAVHAKQGLLELAHQGTLFLDEIGDVDPQVQPKLLKVLEEKRYRRLGEVKDRTVNVRLIAATHHHLAEMVKRGHFRGDLYFRINTVPIRVPALRERREDIPSIAEALLHSLANDLGRPKRVLTEEAVAALRRHDWPGNVRELRNVLERTILLGTSEEISSADLFFDRSFDRAQEPPAHRTPLLNSGFTLEEVEHRYIEHVLELTNFKVETAAARLGVPRSSLYQKIKRFGIHLPRSRQISEG